MSEPRGPTGSASVNAQTRLRAPIPSSGAWGGEDAILAAIRAGEPLADVLVLDVHAHVGWSHNMAREHASAGSMVPIMDRMGIDAAAISSCLAITSDVPDGNNEVLAALDAFPGRFIGAAVVNPHYPDEIEPELERMFARPGVAMIKVHPSFHAYPLDGPAYEPVWVFAERRRIPVISHTWGEGRGFDHPLQAERVAQKHPRLPLILGHAGGSPAGVLAAIGAAKRTPNLYLDTGTSVIVRGATELQVKEAGADRVLFGSDCSYTAHPSLVGKVAYARIPEADKERVLGRNLAILLAAADLDFNVMAWITAPGATTTSVSAATGGTQ